MHKESIQMYLMPNSRVTEMASWNVRGRWSKENPDLWDKKLEIVV
jgi:hypothetical protein